MPSYFILSIKSLSSLWPFPTIYCLRNLLSSFLPLPFCTSLHMATSTDPLVVSRIIGDVVDMFVPSITMNIYYGPKHVTNGCNIKPSMAINPPRFTITGHSHELYTLVCPHVLCYVNFTCILLCFWSFNNNNIGLILSVHVGFRQAYWLF